MAQQIIDMQFMRYMNLFEKISHVTTTTCFAYNNTIVFPVPGHLVMKAIGRNGENVKQLNVILRKRIKVIELPADDSLREMEKFVKALVEPIMFNKIELLPDNTLTISGNRQSNAALIGRDRTRERELEDILKKFFKISKLHIA
jgi:transcription antitermination factor NusA-like protein